MNALESIFAGIYCKKGTDRSVCRYWQRKRCLTSPNLLLD